MHFYYRKGLEDIRISAPLDKGESEVMTLRLTLAWGVSAGHLFLRPLFTQALLSGGDLNGLACFLAY